MHRIGGIRMGPRKRNIEKYQYKKANADHTELVDDVRS